MVNLDKIGFYQKVYHMLHNEARRLLVQAYEQTHDAQTVAKCFQVSTSTVYRLSGQMKKTGSVSQEHAHSHAARRGYCHHTLKR